MHEVCSQGQISLLVNHVATLVPKECSQRLQLGYLETPTAGSRRANVECHLKWGDITTCMEATSALTGGRTQSPGGEASSPFLACPRLDMTGRSDRRFDIPPEISERPSEGADILRGHGYFLGLLFTLYISRDSRTDGSMQSGADSLLRGRSGLCSLRSYPF